MLEFVCVGVSCVVVCVLFSGDVFSFCVFYDLVKREIKINE